MPEEKNTTIVGDGHDNYAQAAQNAIRAKTAFRRAPQQARQSFRGALLLQRPGAHAIR